MAYIIRHEARRWGRPETGETQMTMVEITIEGDAPFYANLADFLTDNADDREFCQSVRAALYNETDFVGGGGAEPFMTIRKA